MVEITRLCANSGCENPGKHLCSGCGEEIYCSKECQKAHWTVHKQACKSAVKPEAAMFIKSFDQLSVKQLKNIMIAKASTFDTNKKNKILQRVESIVEKPALVKLVKDHVQPEEVEALLRTPASVKVEAASSSGNSSASSRSGKNKNMQTKTTFEGGMGTPTPEQLRQQANLMRKNPGLVRKAQPAFANLTDEQIRQYADQLEMAAKDPNILKEVEKMAKLSPDDRTLLQSIQEGLSGVKPIDDAWIAMIIDSLKKKPELFKTLFKGKGAMFGGVSDDQIDGFIDMANRMDKFTLKIIAYAIWYVGSAARPLSEIYKKVDGYTFGTAKYILLGIFAMVMYYVFTFFFGVARWIVLKLYGLVMYLMNRNGAKVTQTIAQQAASTVEGEFADAATATISKIGAAAVTAKVGQAAMSGNAPAATAAVGESTAKAGQDDEFEF